MIYEIPNFLEIETCDALINYFKTSNQRSEWQTHEFYRGRTLCPSEIDDFDIRRRMEIFKSKSIQMVSKIFNEKFVFLEFWDLVHWGVGYELGPHADNMYQDRSPNYCFQRDYTSVCYLNHDYEGGHTYFVYENKKYIPEKGKVIFYPSGLQFTHGVSKVLSGDRYTLSSWYTKDQNYIFFK